MTYLAGLMCSRRERGVALATIADADKVELINIANERVDFAMEM